MSIQPKLLVTWLVLLVAALALGACATAAPPTDPPVVEASFAGDAEAGLLLFNENCVVCHSATLPRAFTGPSLYQVGDRLTADFIQDSVREPHSVVAAEYTGSTPMPTDLMERLSDQDLADIVAFLLAGQP